MLTTAVPLNTMLADLDDSLRELLRRELGQHGFEGLEIEFDAPTRDWAATLAKPTVNLFLYDLREARDARQVEWQEHEGIAVRPPLRIDASFAVTAWTREVQDEHRLLSQILAVLYAYPEIPEDVLHGGLTNGSQPFPIRTRVAQPRQEGAADFWSAVGGEYKASIDLAVTLTATAGTTLQGGPEVRTQTFRFRQIDGVGVFESHRVGGTVRDAAGEPVGDAWVILHETGEWTVSDREGRFRFDRLEPGSYTIAARAADGGDAQAPLVVPGGGADLVIGEPPRRRRR
jgi:hypothetical protein